MTEDMAARNERLIRDHFAALIDGKDLGAIERNLAPDFYDHDGPGGRPEASAEAPMIAALHKRVPDVRVEVRDAVASGDLVIVRNVWSGTEAATGKKIECHGFVQWRIRDGKIVERWATVTQFRDMDRPKFEW
jgi:ketosteroid isomerase-like protein